MVRIIIVDDHPVVREGIAGILSGEPDLQVVGETDTAEEAIPRIAKSEADVVVLDIRLPGISGIEASGQIHKRHPDVGVVILTSFPDEQGMVSALGAGARGFLRKESDPAVLRQAVRSVAEGGTFVDPNLTASLVNLATKGMEPRGPYGLTRQELRVLSFLPQGLTNREIGDRLAVSDQTVKTHLRSLFRKIEVHDRAGAAGKALREGLI